MDGTVYLLHFARPLSERHACQHYIGWSLDLDERLTAHRAGRGARLTQIAVTRGIGFEVVRTWIGSRDFERYLKHSWHGPRLCPLCCAVRGRRPALAGVVEQLALPLFDDGDDFPDPPALPMDGYEYFRLRCWRQASAAPAPALAGADDGDIPY